jgi:hypothetical protein
MNARVAQTVAELPEAKVIVTRLYRVSFENPIAVATLVTIGEVVGHQAHGVPLAHQAVSSVLTYCVVIGLAGIAWPAARSFVLDVKRRPHGDEGEAYDPEPLSDDQLREILRPERDE